MGQVRPTLLGRVVVGVDVEENPVERRSRFVVAEFSGNRGGVYFEAGFAMGLGLPVVWVVRESDLPDVHFDTNHFNHITWATVEELRIKLQRRIEATIPRPPKS